MRHSQTPNGCQQRQHGYSIIELVVAVTLIGVAALTILPYVAGMTIRHRANDSIRQVENALQLARMKAISQQTNHVVQFTDAGFNIFRDEDEDGIHDSDEDWVYPVEIGLPPGISYGFPDLEATDVANSLPVHGCKCAEFQSSGLMKDALTNNGDRLLAIGDGKLFRRVSITLGGAVTIDKWDEGAQDWK